LGKLIRLEGNSAEAAILSVQRTMQPMGTMPDLLDSGSHR
jgi:hypothetical protein